MRMTIVSVFQAMALLALPLATLAAPQGDFFVSPGGRDSWSGRLPAPNHARTDGPYASIQRAAQEVRSFRRDHPNLARPVRITMRGGFYSLPDTFRLTPEDSGSASSPTLYAAYPGEHPVLSGGMKLKGWKTDSRGWWHLVLPEVAAGRWYFQQLFANDGRRYRPRLPKSGYYTIEDALPPSPAAQGKGIDRFRFRPGELRADWHALGDVEVLGFQIWTMARFRIKAVDETERTVAFTGTTRGLEFWGQLPKGNRYLIENVRESLGQPGEFNLDRASGELTYIPITGEDPVKTEVIAPQLDTLVEFHGDPGAHKWVEHVQFHGLTFAHSNWVTPPEGNSYPQAEVNLGGAISAIGARDCLFDDCRIAHTGIYAIDFGTGCKRNVIRSCRLTDLGAGGVKIGLQSAPQDEELVASDNTVQDCLIAHGGRLHPAAVGVWIGHSHHNRILRNEIADFYYTGISVGWSWGYGQSLAHDNLLERNHIHDLGQGVLSDMGGIYTLGLSPGTVERGNRIHDVDSFDYGGWGIYPDEGSTDILIEDNVVFRTKSAPFHQHYGKENIVRNNVFALGRTYQLMRTREEEHSSFTMERNIVYWRDATLLGSNWNNGHFKLDYNLYWNASGQPVMFAGKALEAWRLNGQDAHSVVADPLFVDPEHGDFLLKPGSPALQLGFRSIDPAISAPPKRSEPLAPPAFPPIKH